MNRPEDIHSLLAFLDVKPLGAKNIFKARVSDPIKERREIGLTVLRTAMAHVALRRSKNIVKDRIKLVDKTVQIRAITFPPGYHDDVHNVLYGTARATFLSFLMRGRQGQKDVLDNYMGTYRSSQPVMHKHNVA